jgi:hypothetical protein
VLLRRLAAYPRQNALARALREIGCLERTLFILDWISDPALRRRSNAGPRPSRSESSRSRPPKSRGGLFLETVPSAKPWQRLLARHGRLSLTACGIVRRAETSLRQIDKGTTALQVSRPSWYRLHNADQSIDRVLVHRRVCDKEQRFQIIPVLLPGAKRELVGVPRKHHLGRIPRGQRHSCNVWRDES